MIVLDTNVVSELFRPRPEPAVVRWLDAQPAGEVAITAVTAAELLYGVARLPAGRRQAALAEAVVAVLREDFDGRILPFDAAAAESYAEVVAARDRNGRPISQADAQIVATCASLGLPLATRNTKDVTDTGIPLVDPWHDAP